MPHTETPCGGYRGSLCVISTAMKSVNRWIFQTFLLRKRRAIELVTKVSLTIISTGPATAQAMLPFLVTRADEYTHVRELKVKGIDGTLPPTTRLVLKFKNEDSRAREGEREAATTHNVFGGGSLVETL